MANPNSFLTPHKIIKATELKENVPFSSYGYRKVQTIAMINYTSEGLAYLRTLNDENPGVEVNFNSHLKKLPLPSSPAHLGGRLLKIQDTHGLFVVDFFNAIPTIKIAKEREKMLTKLIDLIIKKRPRLNYDVIDEEINKIIQDDLIAEINRAAAAAAAAEDTLETEKSVEKEEQEQDDEEEILFDNSPGDFSWMDIDD